MQESNWAGNFRYQASAMHRPRSLQELRSLVVSKAKLRVLGSRHTFSAIADGSELVSLERMPADVVVDEDRRTISFGAQLTYGELAGALGKHGLALRNLASLPHICVAGAVATGTHGSGDGNGNLATAVAGIEVVTADGEVLVIARDDRDFDGAVIALGALGVVTRLTLDVEPAYEVRQCVFEGLSWQDLLDHFDAITASGYSVSIFTRWSEADNRIWVKTRVAQAPEVTRHSLFGARLAEADRHVLEGLDPVNCTPQLGVPGPWAERLPHFRMGFAPSAGAEIQSEYLVARRHAVEAMTALHELANVVTPILQVAEIRTVARDSLWLSPQYAQDTVGFHFTWRREQETVERALVKVEEALAPFAPRPHWGKLFLLDATTLATRYPRVADFVDLARRLDPNGKFTNEWLERHVLGLKRC
jgi:alditol oxidase